MRLFKSLSSSNKNIRLNGQRVFLRPPKESDWRAYVEVRSISRDFLEPWEPTWPPDALSYEAFSRYLSRHSSEWRDHSGSSFFIFRNDDETLLGGISLSNLRRGVSQCGTLGYWIGKPHSRKGYMTEALNLINCFCFDDLQLHRVEAACLPHNQASKRLLVRSGFNQDGYAQKYMKINGKWHDHLLFSLLGEDYRRVS
ncbi:MAG: GNAT family N-acetyltransferase [Alphaproteobacteria bacterium]|nr:GNAT family N-acetyltransferase [Alphaproteobacteria bacterium]